MEFELAPYTSDDREQVEALTAELQDYIAKIDFTVRHRAKEDFDAHAYFELRYKQIQKYNGRILLAKKSEEAIAVAMFYVEDNTDDLEIYPEKTGVLQELYIHEKYRGMGIGQSLMKAAESYFLAQGCTHMRTLCFAPNHPAHNFYEKLGFKDYCHEMIKAL